MPATYVRASSISATHRIGRGRRSGPFAEGPAGRGERLPGACRDQLLDPLSGQFDDEVAGAVVAGGEERAGDS